MKNVIVTGGAGFIGSHTVVELAACGYRPIVVDDFSNSDVRVVDGLRKILGYDVPVYRIDCANYDQLAEVFKKENADSVIHFAAYKAVGESVRNPLKYYHNNLVSMLSVLKMLRAFKTKSLVFSSSCTVYGQPTKLPVTEDNAFEKANSPYGYTKQVCEKMIEDFIASETKASAVLLRYFNPIGAHPSAHIGELPFGVPSNLIPFITQTAAGIREELIIHGNDYGTPDGTCLRDYIHVVDLAKAHVKALEWMTDKTNICEPFNLGQGKGISVLEVVNAFEKISSKKLNYRFGARRSGDVEKVWADVSKANSVLNWRTELSMDNAIGDAWRWQQTLSKIS